MVRDLSIVICVRRVFVSRSPEQAAYRVLYGVKSAFGGSHTKHMASTCPEPPPGNPPTPSPRVPRDLAAQCFLCHDYSERERGGNGGRGGGKEVGRERRGSREGSRERGKPSARAAQGRSKVTFAGFPTERLLEQAGARWREKHGRVILSCFINKKIAGTFSRYSMHGFKTRATR